MSSLWSAASRVAGAVVFLMAGGSSTAAQAPAMTLESSGVEWRLPDPARTRYFELSNGMIGGTIPRGVPNAAGIDWKQFMSGVAYAMKSEPGAGPACDSRGPGPRITFWTIAASPIDSRMAINAEYRLGAVYVRGAMQRYVQARDFCKSKKFVKAGSPGSGYIYMPMAPMGTSLRNFTAMSATVPRGNDSVVVGTGGVVGGAQMIPRATGVISGPGISERLGGYTSADMLGVSQAFGDGPGGAAAAEAMQQALAQNPQAAAALSNMPGVVPGKDSQGAIDLNLSNLPMTRMAGRDVTVLYVHVRAVHTSKEVTGGRALTQLQQLFRATGELTSDPFAPNSTR